ncbi:MAG: hypothetical protein K2Q28_10910 [Hyphomicrobium sp.]|nr:hypothetical protein [Hyphomicrobium sp.]
MLSILKFSGTHWSRSAIVWLVFAFVVQGLANAGAESADAKIAAYHAAVALGVLHVAEPSGSRGHYQVAKVEFSDFDLRELDPAVFADQDGAAASAPR